MSFVTIEDETAVLETVWFPESYKRYGSLLSAYQPLRLTGIVDAPFGCVSVHVRHVAVLKQSKQTTGKSGNKKLHPETGEGIVRPGKGNAIAGHIPSGRHDTAISRERQRSQSRQG